MQNMTDKKLLSRLNKEHLKSVRRKKKTQWAKDKAAVAQKRKHLQRY